MLVQGWLGRAAAARPDHIALRTGAGDWTYTQLLLAAQLGARELQALGARAGDRVAIALPAGLGFAQALHSCLLLGALAVPLDVRAPAAERERLAAGARLVLEEPLPQPERSSPVGPVQPSQHAGAMHELGATAAVIHTSGTSSAPRAVELTYGNFLWSALGSAVALGVDAADRWLCALPVWHVSGLSILLRSAIYGTTAVVHERFDGERVLHALRAEGITIISLVATTLARLLDAGLTQPPALRCALTGGGPVPAALVRRAHAAGVPVSLTYGLTEACSQVTTTPVCALASEGPVPGPPLFCTSVAIAADGSDSPGAGEILVAGPTVAPAALQPDGWLHTADAGFIDERGRLQVTGRRDDVIISGGENIAPSEVEAVFEAHPQVLEAAVVGRPDPQWGEALTAIVVARPGAEPQATALREHCALALAPHKVPREIVVRSEPLPRTGSGKLIRRELRCAAVG